MQKKVLFTASTFSHILNFHLPYIRQFKETGWQVQVGCGGSLPEDIPGADSVFQLPLEKKMVAAANFRAVSLLQQKIAAERYDLISTHTSLAAFFTRLALPARRARKGPLLLNMVHGYLFDGQTPWPKRRLLLGAEQLTAGRTDLLLTMNRWDLAAAQRYHLGRQIDFIPGVGVDFSRFSLASRDEALALRSSLGLRPEDFVLIYGAEFSGRKSQSLLLQALAGLTPEDLGPVTAGGGRLALLLPGSGSLLEDCRKLAAKLQLPATADEESWRPLVLFPGQQKNMPLWYAAANGAVSASRSEGLPFNIMEAMYAGLPVVASQVKGHQDLLAEGETGLLYPYGDSAACARQLKRLWQEPQLARALGERAQKAVSKYSLERVLPQVWAQYERLLEI